MVVQTKLAQKGFQNGLYLINSGVDLELVQVSRELVIKVVGR